MRSTASNGARITRGLAAAIGFDDSGPEGSSGPPLLLVHGAGGTRLSWPEALRALPGRRVVALDLPGHGRSPGPGERSVAAYARRVLGLLDALEMGAAVVVGHSMGGAIALTLALEARSRIAGLVLVGTGARLRVRPAVLEVTAGPALRAETARGMAEHSFGSGAGEALLGEHAAGLMANAPGVLHGDFLACDAFDVMGRLGEVSAPTLVVCGTEDRLTPPRYSEFLQANIGGARLEWIAGAGHMAMLEAPDQVAAAVDAFCTGRWPRTGAGSTG